VTNPLATIAASSFITVFLFQYIKCESKKNPPLRFSDIFPKQLGIFNPNSARLLYEGRSKSSATRPYRRVGMLKLHLIFSVRYPDDEMLKEAV